MAETDDALVVASLTMEIKSCFLLLALVSRPGSTHLIGQLWITWSRLSRGTLTFVSMRERQLLKSKLRLLVPGGGTMDAEWSCKDLGSKVLR